MQQTSPAIQTSNPVKQSSLHGDRRIVKFEVVKNDCKCYMDMHKTTACDSASPVSHDQCMFCLSIINHAMQGWFVFSTS